VSPVWVQFHQSHPDGTRKLNRNRFMGLLSDRRCRNSIRYADASFSINLITYTTQSIQVHGCDVYRLQLFSSRW